MPDYPERAALECLVNALIHRDYMELGSEVHIDIFDNRMEIYSPGGMFDGSLVQNLDTDLVASKRRNPIIADIFSRMKYMERRGSGFKKIKGDYQYAYNYRQDLAPKFQSTATSFFVTLYNLNYNVPAEKVAFGQEKVAFGQEKIDIDLLLAEKSISQITARRISALYDSLGYAEVFSRKDIISLMSVSSTYAGRLINQMKELGLIIGIAGKGKGKYKFNL